MKNTLVVGDPHLRVSHLEDSKLFLLRLREEIVRVKPSRLIILGDLFHTHAVIRNEIMALWANFFGSLNVFGRPILEDIILLVGNHDYASLDGEGSHALEAFKYNARIIVVGSPTVHEGINYLPYIRSKLKFEEICRTLQGPLVCHQSFSTSKFDSGMYDPDGADPKCVEHLPYVISGHIHKRQKVLNIWHPGTPFNYGHGEDTDKRIFLTEMDQLKYLILEEIDLGLPVYRTIEASSLEELTVSISKACPDDNTNYRLIAEGSPAEIEQFWKLPAVQDFKSKARSIQDSLTTRRPDGIYSRMKGKSTEEKIDEFISGRKWRTSPEAVGAAVRPFMASVSSG